MAVFTGTYQTYQAQGIREDLADMIFNITPEDTPILSSVGRRSAKNVLFEWQTDALAAAVTTNQQIEGDDITTFPTVTPTKRVGNRTEISRKLVIIAGTMEAVDKAGRRSELAYELAKKGAELKLDMESSMMANKGGVAGDASTPRQTAGLGAWVKTNVNLGAGGGNPVYTTGVPGAARTNGTQRNITTTIIDDVMSQCYTSGAKPSVLSLGSFQKQKASQLTTVVSRNFDLSNTSPRPTAIIGAVDVYVSDFGVLRIQPSRNQRGRDGWFLDFNFLGIDILRNFRQEKLAKTGDAEKRMLLIEWGLRVKNEAALGLAADLSTA